MLTKPCISHIFTVYQVYECLKPCLVNDRKILFLLYKFAGIGFGDIWWSFYIHWGRKPNVSSQTHSGSLGQIIEFTMVIIWHHWMSCKSTKNDLHRLTQKTSVPHNFGRHTGSDAIVASVKSRAHCHSEWQASRVHGVYIWLPGCCARLTGDGAMWTVVVITPGCLRDVSCAPLH